VHLLPHLLQQEDPPPWVLQLQASGMLVKVPRFSKFLHGMSLLYPGSCSTSPSWFLWDESAGCAAPASLAEMKTFNEDRDAAWKQPSGAEQVMP
jgi:SPX domain protein involved in polyphosphate accumulation